MRDPHTKDSRGFAFVTMETSEEADAAVAALNAQELMGRVMNVEKARRGRARTPTPGQYHGPPKREGGSSMPSPASSTVARRANACALRSFLVLASRTRIRRLD